MNVHFSVVQEPATAFLDLKNYRVANHGRTGSFSSCLFNKSNFFIKNSQIMMTAIHTNCLFAFGYYFLL